MLYNNKSNVNSPISDSHHHENSQNNPNHIAPHVHGVKCDTKIPSPCCSNEHATSSSPSIEETDLNTKLVWKVQGMDCAHCAQKIENAIKQLPDVLQVKIIFATEKLIVYVKQKDQKMVDQIQSKILELGYQPIFQDNTQHSHHAGHSHGFDKKAFRPLLILGSLIVVSYLILLLNKPLGEYAFMISAVIGLIPIAKEALQLMRSGTPFAIESLMSISAIGALFIGAAEEACMVIFLFMIGEMLEGVATSKAKKGISSLVALMPEQTVLLVDGKRLHVKSHTLKPDDVIEISSGGRLPADVMLLSEQAAVDESALTGESMPVSYSAGQTIMAGSLIVDQTVQLKVISKSGQNAVDRILQLIEDAEDRKAPIERFIDKFSRYYTPAIALFSLLVIIVPPLLTGADWYTWIYRGLTLLLIGCPCALVISTPAVITSALSSAARHGVLIKGGAALEHIGSIKTIAFDKTGTLTEGKPQLTDIISNQLSQPDLIKLAASIESGSHHPLAKAIVDYANNHHIAFVEAENRKAIAGIGIQGDSHQQTVYIVSPNKIDTISSALTEQDKSTIAQLEQAGKTVIVVCTKEALLGIIALQDVLRKEAFTAIQQLHQLGLQTVMLTGDNERAAKAIASQLNMAYRAELLPADKLTEIEKIRTTQPIAMVGDGINDSPAMKAATVGIAMGTSSDVALETADAALTHNNLLSLPALIKLTRFANRNIKQNITIALGIKLVFLVTSLLGITGLWLAVLADSGTTAIVTANALRLLRVKK